MWCALTLDAGQQAEIIEHVGVIKIGLAANRRRQRRPLPIQIEHLRQHHLRRQPGDILALARHLPQPIIGVGERRRRIAGGREIATGIITETQRADNIRSARAAQPVLGRVSPQRVIRFLNDAPVAVGLLRPTKSMSPDPFDLSSPRRFRVVQSNHQIVRDL